MDRNFKKISFSTGDLVEEIFEGIYDDPDHLNARAILCPKNVNVDQMNLRILNKMTGKEFLASRKEKFRTKKCLLEFRFGRKRRYSRSMGVVSRVSQLFDPL